MTETEAPTRPAEVAAQVDAWLRTALERAHDRSADPARGGEGGRGACESRVDAVRAAGGGAGANDAFARAISAVSRYAPRGPLLTSADAEDLAAARALVPGWTPERWTALEAARVRLVLARADADDGTLPEAVEEAFRFADEGELRALYRSLQFLPGPERFAWRAKEGCRTNMKSVFEANGCDTVYPVQNFDDIAWRQLCMKSLFVEAPLWRVVGFDDRVDDELARMALDLADERRAAGRSVFPELWMCLGRTPSARALESVAQELAGEDDLSRKGAVLALGRMGQTPRLQELQGDFVLSAFALEALEGRHTREAFAAVSPAEGARPGAVPRPAAR